MVNENPVAPFMDWLLGPGWSSTVLFQGLPLAILLVILLAGLAGAVVVLRTGSFDAARWIGRLLVAKLVAFFLLLLLLLPAVLQRTERIAPPLRRLSEQLAGALKLLLGDGWTTGTIYIWLLLAASVTVGLMLLGLLVSALKSGPIVAIRTADETLASVLVDVANVSPRRVFALALLAVKESIRRRVVVGFAVFILVLSFAGWFLDPGSNDPGRLYLGFVLTTTSYLVLALALFLSSMSLPADIRSKTLHTVVTKPVRPGEIVLGRIVGFSVIGTALLAVMGTLSGLFVVRGLSHTHSLMPEDVEAAEKAFAQTAADKRERTVELRTSLAQGHRHTVQLDIMPDGSQKVEQVHEERGHTHDLTYELAATKDKSPSAPAKLTYTLGASQGNLMARVPVYGKLAFLTKDGIEGQGINVGDEWTYRSYIQGGTRASAVWSFDKLRPEDYSNDEIPVEMNIGVFRTHKGDIEKGVLGSICVRNPTTGLLLELEVFESKEFTVKRLTIPRHVLASAIPSKTVVSRIRRTEKGQMVADPPQQTLDRSLAKKKEYDLFKDVVTDDGRMEIWLRCLDPAQYFGVAQPDLYIRSSDAPFAWNFAKGYLGIWLQMVLLVSFGVMFSTFLSGPVAMIATMGTLVGGLFSDFMLRLGSGNVYGGGPMESSIRLVKQQNMMSDLDPGMAASLAKATDSVLQPFLWAMAHLLPAFSDFSFAVFVADGYDIPGNLIWVRVVSSLAFVLPLSLMGLFFLKTREIAQ